KHPFEAHLLSSNHKTQPYNLLYHLHQYPQTATRYLALPNRNPRISLPPPLYPRSFDPTYPKATTTSTTSIGTFSPSPLPSPAPPITKADLPSPRLLNDTSSLDLVLSTTSYTLALISSLLPFSSSSTSTPSPSPKPHLSARTAKLASLLSETRTTLRLFGLVPIYTGIYSTYLTPSAKSTIPTTLFSLSTLQQLITPAQILAGTIFQILENLAWLGDKEILPLSAKRRGKYWIWCCRAWALYVFLELARLLQARPQSRQFHDDASTKLGGEGEKSLHSINGEEKDATREEGLGVKEEQETWLRNMKINLAYAPMTLHYSFANGLMNDGTVALCGVLASYWGLKGVWKKTE
ncbi:MAG: hypothetical protein Q9169_007043, partial [Polycauliona sp. 2 TL-2023]